MSVVTVAIGALALKSLIAERLSRNCGPAIVERDEGQIDSLADGSKHVVAKRLLDIEVDHRACELCFGGADP